MGLPIASTKDLIFSKSSLSKDYKITSLEKLLPCKYWGNIAKFNDILKNSC